jgi:serine phosphatase RsbU (regulator of sigma subunit)
MELHSLKTKFLAVIVLIGVVIGGVTLVAFTAGTGSIINELALRFATKEALLKKNKIISIIEREVVLARKMADDTTLMRWATDENNGKLKQQSLEELESYRRLYRDRSFFIALAGSHNYYFYDKRAKRTDSVVLEADKQTDRWYFDGLRTIGDYALNLDYNPTQQEAKIWLNVIMKGSNGKKLGICGSGITITDFLNEIVHAKEKGVSTILIDRQGVIQAHEDRSIVEHNANYRDAAQKITVFNLMDDPATRKQLGGAMASLVNGMSEVAAFPARFGGKQYLLAVSSIEGISWLNVVLVDVSRVISSKEFLPIVAIMALSLLLAISMIGLLMSRMVLIPLARISAASREVAAGRYDITLPVKGNDELAALTGSFNTMTATVLDYTNNLEAMVRQRTSELLTANQLLEESQQRIMDSISYAHMIQSSILPEPELMQRCLGEHFVLYRPKELVGGDFYYLREFPRHLLVAVVDCTGHGIPGAFMTMTVNSVLNHVVDQTCNDNPATILAEINRVMRQTLHMKEVDAGLDIALCLLEPMTGRILFAGAGLNLHLASPAGVREVRGNRQRIGYKGSRLDYDYSNHELQLARGECAYLTSDGILDEAGGEKGFGFGVERFKAILADNAHLDLPAQCKAIAGTLDAYRGDYPQRDDITLIGFRYGGTLSPETLRPIN